MLGTDRGYTFSLPIGLVNLRGGIFAFLADTPVSNKAGGKVWEEQEENVATAWQTFEEMQCLFVEEDFQPRSTDSCLQQL